MRPPVLTDIELSQPILLDRARDLDSYLKTLSEQQLMNAMKLSAKLATTTHSLIAAWRADPRQQRPAIDSFLGDIYSGLQIADWSSADRLYADEKLRILSGLYGVVRPLDGIFPYRLEMACRLPDQPYSSLYKYWGDAIYRSLPADNLIVNLAAAEYSKLVTDYSAAARVVTPKFLTIHPNTKQPTFVVVHAKIARGSYVRWLIKHRIQVADQFEQYNELGYTYNPALSSPDAPVFVCREFGGIGLSVRLT